MASEPCDIVRFKDDVKKYFGVDLPISGGMGISIENAFIINTDDSCEGIGMERKILNYLFQLMGGKDWKLIKQELVSKENKKYDKLKILWKDDPSNYHNYYFDITQFFGKP